MPIRGLLLACHPLPAAAVTTFGVLLGLRAGVEPGRLGLLALALLSGQVVVGWTNDLLDADGDVRAQRRDKPVVAGLVTAEQLKPAIAVAAIGCAAFSLAVGLLPGILHLVAVASAVGYDVVLKWTALSPLPYLVSFALLPAVASTAAPNAHWPAPSIMLAGGLLGVAAHFANTVPDAQADSLTAVRGLPQRIGPVSSTVVTAALVATVAVLLVLAGYRSAPTLVFLAASVAVAIGAVFAVATRGATRAVWRLALVAAGLGVLGFVVQ